jgi:hypothetical protein
VKIDTSVMGDSARVLRFPGTINYKHEYEKDAEGNKTGEWHWKYGEPKQTRLLQEGDIFDSATLAAHIVSKLKALAPVKSGPFDSNVVQLPGARPAASSTQIKLYENHATYFKNIVDATVAGRGCAQIADYMQNATDDGMEPKWRAVLTLTKHCDDGEKWSKRITKLHPYDEERMHKKLAESKGPWTCKAFDEKFPGVCNGCPAKAANARLTTPLMLGREFTGTTEAKDIEVAGDSPATEDEVLQPTNRYYRPEAPRGFSYPEDGKGGGVFAEVYVKGAKGEEGHTRHDLILPFDFFMVDKLVQDGKHIAHFVAIRAQGAQDVLIDSSAVASKDTTIKALNEQDILATSPEASVHLHKYVWSCIQQGNERRATKVPDQYGWQADGTFVCAGRIFRKGKASVEVPLPGLENIVQATKPKGTIEGWRAYINTLKRHKLYKALAVFLFGAAAPLMRYTGLYGMTIHCASTESGTGKSLGLMAAASVWGHPTHYRTGKNTSDKAMVQRLGLLQSLPVVTDEITNKNRNDFEWFPNFLFEMTDGKGRERMEGGANKERLNKSTWSTLAIMSSNTYGVDYLLTGRRHTSDGEVRRLLEFEIEEVMQGLSDEDRAAITGLNENFGVAGTVLAQFMVDNEEHLSGLVQRYTAKVRSSFNSTDDERFWTATVGCAVAMSVLLGSKHGTGLVDLPMDMIMGEMRLAIERTRAKIKSGQRTASGVIDSYIQENYGKLLIVRYMEEGKRKITAELGGLEMARDVSVTRSQIAGRVEHDKTPGHTDLYIDKKAIARFANEMGFGWDTFLMKLKADPQNVLVEVKMNKTMSSDTNVATYRADALRVMRKKNSDAEEEPEPALATG